MLSLTRVAWVGLASLLVLAWGCRGLTFRVSEENDVGGFGGGTDRFYTQGLRLDVNGPLPGPVPGLSPLARLLWVHPGSDDYAFQQQHLGVAAGHQIFTPEDITIEALQPDDRPYAGWLYGAISWHNLALGHIPYREEASEPSGTEGGDHDVGQLLYTRNDRLDSLEIQLGTVGPDSLAEEVQTRFHELIGARNPEGWDNQLDNELGGNVVYTRKLRNNHSKFPLLGLEHDLITNFGGSLGNIETFFQVGGQARIGHNLRRDFGLGTTVANLALEDLAEESRLPKDQLERFRAQFGQRFSWYGFIGVDGRFVARNIFLDGNRDGDSHSVEKERFVADFLVGVALQFQSFEISYTQVARTPEFRRASDPQIFGSLQVVFRF